MQSAWKQCLHSGINLIVSFLQYSVKQMAHTVSFGPGTRLLSPSTTFSYDSMVDSSNPNATTVAGSGVTAAVGFVWFPWNEKGKACNSKSTSYCWDRQG
ncbi:hypothetical protein LINGRAHAP2_LOCUS14933 [Linum grandiflorum]